MTSSPEIQKYTPEILSPEKIQQAREALAKRWGMALDQIPEDGRILKLFDKSLDDLSAAIKSQKDPMEQARILKEKLASIETAELADKAADTAKELAKKGKNVLEGPMLEQTTKAITTTTEKLANEGLAVGQDAIKAVGAIATAGSVDEATKGIDSLSKVIDVGTKAIGKAVETIKDIFVSLFKMLGLDKLFKSIGGLFGMKFDEKGEKVQDKIQKGAESLSTTARDIRGKLETKEGRQDFIEKVSKSFSEKISKTYFGEDKLSEAQMKKLYSIFDESLNTESIVKVAERLDKGEINIGELFDATLDVAGSYPAHVMWELSLSGIIPFWAITQHVVLNPAGNLIKLTFDGLGLPVTSISLENFGSMLEKKAQGGDSHALDMARVQLYGVNSVLFRTIGTVLGSAVAGGIMFTNTTTGVDGLKHLSKLSYLKEYDTLASEFGKIEGILARGSGHTDKLGAFTHMLDGVRDLRANSLVMEAVTRNTVKGRLNHQGIIDALDSLVASNPELKHINTQALKASLNNENAFREAIKNLIKGPSSTAGIADALRREMAKYGGGRAGEALRYLEHIDSVKKWQQSLIGDVGTMSEKLKRLKLSYESLKLARSGDTVILHMENMDDISKFRAFLSTIPGGIRALSEVIPATSLAISLGSVAWDARDKKDGITGESLMDVCKTALIPAYGTWGIIRDKTVNFGQMIADGDMPEFSDIALTGVVGGVFLYEVTRVGSGLIDMKNGNFAKGVSKLTYMHDIGRGIGQISRGVRNIASLATKPAANPEFSKMLARVVEKMPRKGRLAVGAAALLAASGAYAYFSGPESPETVRKNLTKDGWIDQSGKMTDKLKEQFYLKSTDQRKEILDNIFILFSGENKNLPKTHYDEATGKYSLVGALDGFKNLVDSDFRRDLQSLGLDIDLMKDTM